MSARGIPAPRSRLAAGRTRAIPDWVVTLAAVVLLNALGGLSALVGDPPPQNAWYQTLVLPPAQPPGWAFGLAWTLLYSLLGFLLARVLAAPPGPDRQRALLLFGLQFALNLAWSPVFFALEAIAAALLLLLALKASAIAATLAIGRLGRRLAWAMVPYLVWLGYALVLNWRILALNPGA